jgi:hypothetical protein
VSLGRCLPALVDQGKLSPDQAKHARELYDGHVEELTKSMSLASAEAVASKRTVDALDFEAAERKRRTLLQVKAQDFAEQWLTRGGEHWGGGSRGGGAGGGSVPGEGPVGPANPKAGKTLIGLVEARRKAIEGEAFGHIAEILRNHRAILPGVLRHEAEMDQLGMEAFGEDSGSVAAKEAVQAVRDTQEWLRLRANAGGANIGKLEDRGFATHHDSRKVAEAGFEQWAADEAGWDRMAQRYDPARARWDLARMIDEETGQPFTQKRLDEAALAVFATIASDGASNRAPGATGQLSFANRLGQHRFIHYKSYADWKSSQAQYGAGTAFDALLGEVKGMARAIAAMEILGPNPEATVRYVRDRITGDPALFEPGKLRARDKAETHGKVISRLWDEYTGALRQPENRTTALAFSTYRSLASAAKLGSSPITAMTDMGYGMATRRFNGLPVAGLVTDYLKLLNPLNPEHKLAAAYLSFVPEVWTSGVSGQSRFLAEELTGEFGRRVSDGVLRAAGLSAITEAGRQAHGLVNFIYATMVREKAYGELEPAWRAALQRYRIGPAEWDHIRTAPVERLDNGLHLLTPTTIGDGEAKNRFLEMAHNEQDFAVPSPDLETRSLLSVNARKGTLTGELLRSSPLLFRTFLISTLLRHGGRMVEQNGVGGKLGYLLSVVAPVTVMGVLAQQLYEIANGRDPRPMDPTTPEGRNLWGQGFLRGGSLSMLGDLIGLAAQGRYLSATEYAAGALAGDVDRALNAGRGLIEGKPRAKQQAAQLAKEQVPGSNVWYLRLAVDRMLQLLVQRQIDPSYEQSIAAMHKRAAEQGQDFYWAPGETAPRRAPNFANAVTGGTRQ